MTTRSQINLKFAGSAFSVDGCQVAGKAASMCTWDHTAILVVDDDHSGREVLSALLATQGFRVRIAKDGQEALDLLQSGVRPDLFIIDLRLPKVSGPELLKYTHEDPELRCIPAIVVTGLPGPIDVFADEVFIKPVDVVRLLDSVKRLVGDPTRS